MAVDTRERKERLTKTQAVHSSSNAPSGSTSIITKRRGRSPKNKVDSQQTAVNSDPATQRAYSSLESVTNMTNSILNDSDND